MKIRFIPLLGLAAALTATVARAQTTPPVLINNIVAVGVSDGSISNYFKLISGGSGYASGPEVTVTGGGGDGLVLDATVAGGSVIGLEIDPSSINALPFGATLGNVTSGGENFIGNPTLTFSGGGTSTVPASGANFEAYLNFPVVFVTPYQNEGYGPAGRTIEVLSLASGTQPEGGFVYTFTVNGLSIGASTPAASPGTAAGGLWTPPLPGIYVITSTTQDGDGNTAVSPAIRYFATGTALVSSEAGSTSGYPYNASLNGGYVPAGPGTIVPLGSSIILQATATPADGFVDRIVFYTDWTGTNGTVIGTTYSYPYSVIYTPTGASGVQHVIKAIAYDNYGNVIGNAPGVTMDQEVITMVTPNTGTLPTCTIVTPLSNSILEIPDYAADSAAAIPIIVTAGAGENAVITRVELYVNGVLYATDTAYPYNFNWTPSVTGVYELTALAYDNIGNVIASSTATSGGSPQSTKVTIDAAPAIAIVSPGIDATLNSGATASISVVASDTNVDNNGNPVTIQQVQFFQDGNFVGVAVSPNAEGYYTTTFKPVQNTVNGIVEPSQLTAIATDTLGFSGTSPSVQVNVTAGGTGGNVVIGTPPTASLISPTSGQNIVVNTPVTFSASGNAPNGNIQSVAFLVDNQVVNTVTSYPYSATYTFANLGTYQVQTQVVDNVGDKTSSSVVTVNVVPEPPPVVTITGPATGNIVTAGTGVTVTASATSPNGTIASVQFFENNIAIGTASAAPYTATFTPASAGVYTLTAVATDNAGETTTSAASIVNAVSQTTGLGTTTYFGQYQGLSDGGTFAFTVVDGTVGTFIGYSTSGTPTLTYLPDITVSPSGSFKTAAISASASSTGVGGSLLPGGEIVIGTATSSGSYAVASGYYTGNISGQAASQVSMIVGSDGHTIAYISNGSFMDVADFYLDSSGNFTTTTVQGSVAFSGNVNPTSGFLNAKLGGTSGGTVLAARVSGGTFSDGVMKNISTRGQVGNGSDVMIAGFVVGGTAPKQLLVRAVGPTLASFGLTGVLAAPELQVYNAAGTLQTSNIGWSSTNANQVTVAAANAQVGAFALPVGSADSAVVGMFPPGSYTAVVTGVGGTTGLALVEAYDMSTYTPFSTNRLINVSTRANVGAGANIAIGGIIINGSAPKRLLVRGVGPTLASFGVTGALATPHLQIFDSNGNVVRENFTWQSGNDPVLLANAESATGAFTLPNGSADSAILIVLPPGSYTAQLSGVGSATGVGLIEAYEVP